VTRSNSSAVMMWNGENTDVMASLTQISIGPSYVSFIVAAAST